MALIFSFSCRNIWWTFLVVIQMATAAPSPLASSVEKANGGKLSRLLINGGTTVLRTIFDDYHHPANLVTDLNAFSSILSKLLHRRILNGNQWDKLFPPGGVETDSNNFDITLLFLLLTSICGLTPPRSGWHTKPAPGDTSIEANLARVKFYRDVLYGHVTTTGVDTLTFSVLWTEISAVLVGLGLDQAEVDRLKAEEGGEQDCLDALLEWAQSEEHIKSQVKSIHQCQTKMQLKGEEVRQTQLEDQETLLTVEEALQIQTKQHHTVKDVRESQAITHETIEEVHQIKEHTETLKAGLQEVKETIDSLKEEIEKGREDEVLRNLVKSQFRGDIEYYISQFQGGTREWVFDRVQNWLDDRSSQNRVMVISGKAGMGKSVIAAVICKRMQEAGKLSGSHFCQYNNVRYRKPQLMLQSLACHLFHVLPEYKQALVEQLSRNLGMDLNNMGVEELFALLFKEPLSAVGDPGRNMLMVLDGLDESEYQGRNELLDVIAKQFCKLPSWIRFLVTTRPATNIIEKLKDLKPFELQSNDEKNQEDIRRFFEKKLQHVIKLEDVNALLEKLVLKSEGLMLYAHFLFLFINENASVLVQGDLDGSLPLGISSVYYSYFKRLESEIMEQLNIKIEHFLNLLSAVSSSREPLPIGFVSKVLVPDNHSPLAKREVLKALGSVSGLLPFYDGCLHVIHKSVKDWLTDTSSYGNHEFIVEENEGHRILSDLCAAELDDLKRKGVDNKQFSATEKYALYHGARHMLHSGVEREPHKLEELTKVYVMDVELVYAKTCVDSTTAAEDLLWLQKQGIFTMLSESSQRNLTALLFLLKKYRHRFSNNPHIFLQTMLNQGGTVLSAEASNLLQNKYPERPYMEFARKETQQGSVVARFQCSDTVVCLDVSVGLEYMVCECSNEVLQLWSMKTGRLKWTRPVKVPKKNLFQCWRYRNLPSSSATSFYRSVVFHPTEGVVLPGILSHGYTIEGDFQPLFLESNCKFTVCSISGDKTKILTDWFDNSKCLVIWSLKNGSKIASTTRNEDVLSFAWSRDGRLVAISHPTGLVCLVDVMDGFKTLAQTAIPEVCGMLKFSRDHRFLFCLHSHWDSPYSRSFCLTVHSPHNILSLNAYSHDVSFHHRQFESLSDCGFLFGDLISSDLFINISFVLNEQSLLRCRFEEIEMLNTTRHAVNTTRIPRGNNAREIALSLDGQTVYVVTRDLVRAWDVSSEKLIAEKYSEIVLSLCSFDVLRLHPVRRGVLLWAENTKREGCFSGLKLWKFDLSECLHTWTCLPTVSKIIVFLEERLLLVDKRGKAFLLDSTSGEFMSITSVLHGRVIACNSKCQLLTFNDSNSLQLSDGTAVLWKNDSFSCDLHLHGAMFSPLEEFLLIWNNLGSVFVVDAVSGNTLHTLGQSAKDCKFVSDEGCVVSYYYSVKLFNVKSGDLLSEIDVERGVYYLATCPRKCLFAIGVKDSGFQVIQVRLPRDRDSRESRR